MSLGIAPLMAAKSDQFCTTSLHAVPKFCAAFQMGSTVLPVFSLTERISQWIPFSSPFNVKTYLPLGLFLLKNPELAVKLMSAASSCVTRLIGKDANDLHAENVQQLKECNREAGVLPERLRELAALLQMLHLNFHPALQQAESQVDDVKQALIRRETQVQAFAQSNGKINFEELNTALARFTVVFMAILATHGKNIHDLPKFLANLKEAHERVQRAELKLKIQRQELQKTVQEIGQLQKQFEEAGFEGDQEFQALQAGARKLIEKQKSTFN